MPCDQQRKGLSINFRVNDIMKLIGIKKHYYDNDNLMEVSIWRDDRLHSTGRPALQIFLNNGDLRCEVFYQNGLIHRENGPAVEKFYDTTPEHCWFRAHFRHGILHNARGPAREHSPVRNIPHKVYSLNGHKLSVSEFRIFLLTNKNFEALANTYDDL